MTTGHIQSNHLNHIFTFKPIDDYTDDTSCCSSASSGVSTSVDGLEIQPHLSLVQIFRDNVLSTVDLGNGDNSDQEDSSFATENHASSGDGTRHSRRQCEGTGIGVCPTSLLCFGRADPVHSGGSIEFIRHEDETSSRAISPLSDCTTTETTSEDIDDVDGDDPHHERLFVIEWDQHRVEESITMSDDGEIDYSSENATGVPADIDFTRYFQQPAMNANIIDVMDYCDDDFSLSSDEAQDLSDDICFESISKDPTSFWEGGIECVNTVRTSSPTEVSLWSTEYMGPGSFTCS